MKAETKVGLFAVCGVVLFGVAVYMLGNISVGGEYKINVRFHDVSGLPSKSVIKLNGVEIGKVRAIKMDGDGVIVVLGVKKNVPVYKDSVFKIMATSIIGSKYLGVEQGRPAAGVFNDGDSVNGYNELAMDQMLNETMASVKQFVDSVNNNGAFGADLNATLVNLRQLSNNISELVSTLRPYLEHSMEDISDVTVSLKDLMARADVITRQIQDSEGVIGSLINDPEMKDDLKASVSDLRATMVDAREFVGKMSKFRVFWMFDGYYNTDAEAFNTNIALKIYPSNDYMYYRVGYNNIGNEDDSLGSKDYVEKNKIEARLGFYNNYFDLSAGYIRGGGGAELLLMPFYDRKFLNRVSFQTAVTDFGRDRTINGRHFNKPNLLYGVNFDINKYFSVGAGMTDALEVNQPYLKTTIKFQDKDIASFFGLATLAS
ncbi:phospholipid/cholesterol/gamma-HCH transport system substrate-binding protein [Elusimicrobium simillimum]|uniref:MlaD family protein n=1 Tax=Elusimicrobium simillimum TaxID=3143438 RepID=UPI003C6F2B6D